VKPVWIKYYGIIPMTRWGYLIALLAAGAIVSLLVLMAAVAGLLPPLDTMWSRRHHLPSSHAGAWLYNYCYWLILACLVAQGIDTLITLRTFTKKEAEQRAQFDAEWERLGEERPRMLGTPQTHVKADERRPPDERLRPRG
jgi:hypothetical protein